ncbi:hypothetical protein FGRMN_600 [Fusarium graminum]|nr:hypothetical protein FGRMN_600 [Fusarium graminum]
MAEIIGVAASATQLGVACFSLIDTLRKIKGGASTLKRYHEQLQELQSISTCISQNPLLQTPEIGTQTDAIISIINNNRINSLLQKGRVLRTWGFLYREQDLLDIFVRLERQKSNLSLAIEQIQSRTLYRIQTDIQNMSEKKQSASKATETTPENVSGAVIQRDLTGDSPTVDHTSIVGYFEARNVPIVSIASALDTALQVSSKANGPAGQPPGGPSDNHPSPDGPTIPQIIDNAGPQWINSYAGLGCNQENRRIYDIDGELSRELAKNAPMRCIHHNPVKVGPGLQINLNLVEFDGDVTGATLPYMDDDRWYNARVEPYTSSSGAAIVARQINGIEVRRKNPVGAK